MICSWGFALLEKTTACQADFSDLRLAAFALVYLQNALLDRFGSRDSASLSF